MKLKLEFPGGDGRCKTKNFPWREYGYFLELHISCCYFAEDSKENYVPFITHVQSDYFSSLNLLFCGVVVAL